MAAVARCAHCGAVLTPGAQWCSLCLEPLRPAGSPSSAAPPPPLPPPPPGASPVQLPDAAPGDIADPADPDAWLARLAAAERDDPPPLAATFGTRTGRLLVMAGGIVVVIAILALITLFVGRFVG